MGEAKLYYGFSLNWIGMRNFTVTRVWGIPIRINISLVVFLPILVWLIAASDQITLYAASIETMTGTQLDPAILNEGVVPWVIGVLAAVGLFVSVTLHELGHSWVARRYDIHIESITLWILGGIASFKELPREWEKEFWIAVAGPLTSLLVALVCLAAAIAVPGSLPVVVFVLGWLALVNIILVVFNLLPAFPMDGGRVLRALLARNQSYAQATQTAARVGVVFAVLFAVVGVLAFNPILILVAFFVYGAAKTESHVTLIDELLEGVHVSDVLTESKKLEADTPLSELGTRMLTDRRTVYPVTDHGEIVGVVSLDDMKGVSETQLDTTLVRDVMETDLPTVSRSDDAFDTLVLMGESKAGSAFVRDDSGVIGVLSRADFTAIIDIRKELRLAQ